VAALTAANINFTLQVSYITIDEDKPHFDAVC